ncbi:MAG: hypothetical protein BWX80_01589 [Candidatus Hydrogenedentes bacterium ADurb.Bin101]|nr:MAG: hypothetical protein BWX80_01589 [Candidatus Hydrogenedentes bacterium ADurb.Bin101]
MPANKFLERRRAHLFIAFDQILEVDRQASTGFKQRFHRHQLGEDLALHIRGASCVNVIAAYGGFKRGDIHSESGSTG